jgi:hypothetical protein
MTYAGAKGLQAYLVEHYRPGLSVTGLATLAALVRDAAGAMQSEGRPVRYLRSTIVPADEALLSVFESATEELVHAVYARAEVPFDRIGAVIREGGPQWIAVAETALSTEASPRMTSVDSKEAEIDDS